MYVPPPGMIRNSGPHFDQALDQPVHGPLYFFGPDMELPDHIKEVAGQNPHLQPGLVGLKTLAAGFVPAQGVFAFLDPVLHLASAVIDLDDLASWEPAQVFQGISHGIDDPETFIYLSHQEKTNL